MVTVLQISLLLNIIRDWNVLIKFTVYSRPAFMNVFIVGHYQRIYISRISLLERTAPPPPPSSSLGSTLPTSLSSVCSIQCTTCISDCLYNCRQCRRREVGTVLPLEDEGGGGGTVRAKSEMFSLPTMSPNTLIFSVSGKRNVFILEVFKR